MAITIDIDKLRDQIRSLQENLEEKQTVLRYLEKEENKSKPSVQPSSLRARTDKKHYSRFNSSGGFIHLNQLVPEIKRKTFAAEVRGVIKNFGEQEFSMPHVDAALTQMGYENGGKSRRANITTVLGKLEKEGVLKRTYKGTSNFPNRYIVIGKKNDTAAKEVSI